jgi:hypothetical protein
MPNPKKYKLSQSQYKLLMRALWSYQLEVDKPDHPDHKERSVARHLNDELGTYPGHDLIIEVTAT